jgi:hypothetical protein
MQNFFSVFRVPIGVKAWILFLCVFSFSTFAKNHKDHSGFEITHQPFDGWLSEKEFTAFKVAASQRAKRDPARNLEANESMLSPSFKKLRAEFFKIKNKDDLHGFILRADAKYDELDPDAQLFVASLVPLKAFRAYVLKVRPLAEQAKVLHSMLLTRVQQLAVAQEILLPTDQWKAGFEYITQPYDGIDVGAYIKTEYALQKFFIEEVAPEIRRATTRIRRINFSAPFAWDNQMLYGTASFVDNRDRFRLVGKAEQANILARYHTTLSQIAFVASYRLTNGVKLASDLGRLVGVDGFGPEGVTGLTAEKRSRAFQKYKAYGTRYSTAEPWMALSLTHLKESVRWIRIWWNEIENRPANRNFVFNAVLFREMDREIGLSLDNIEALVNGKAQIRSNITGETLLVDLPSLYTNPPADLKVFLPNQFRSGPQALSMTVKNPSGEGTQKVSYRDYGIGQATQWNVPAYTNSFLPEAKSSEDIKRSLRILSQSWGAWFVALPFSGFIL